MARKAGLGRGLDALFADVAPILEMSEAVNADAEDAGEDSAADMSAKAAMAAKATVEKISYRAKSSRSANDKSDSKAKGKTEGMIDAEADSGANAEAVGGANGKTAGKAGDRTNDRSGVGRKAGGAKAKESAAGAASDEDSDRVIYVDINDIKPNSAQPRMHFDEAKLQELAASITANGVIQPLIIRESTNGYELVAGERRWRASRLANLSRVPCIIRNFDDRQNAIVAIIENMQREDLNPIEEAKGLKSMTEKYGFTQEQVSVSLGRSRTYITNSIRLLKLPAEIQEYVSSGKMSAAHGRTIINISDKQKQREVAEKIIRNDLSVRATERLAEKIKDELKPERKRRRKADEETGSRVPEEIKAVESELKTLIGTKVSIKGDENKGRIELEYYSLEELNRIIDLLRNVAE
ncbi:MAG: ParB/RepB/Spo0J family partition protein [Mogibacterium sp.]|nr:ParB/RepB/Spo0J family partition protein [Mogibacterium sp.]